MRVDPYIARLDTSSHAIRTLDILTPDTRAEAHFRIVSLRDGISFVAKSEEGDYGACLASVYTQKRWCTDQDVINPKAESDIPKGSSTTMREVEAGLLIMVGVMK